MQSNLKRSQSMATLIDARVVFPGPVKVHFWCKDSGQHPVVDRRRRKKEQPMGVVSQWKDGRQPMRCQRSITTLSDYRPNSSTD